MKGAVQVLLPGTQPEGAEHFPPAQAPPSQEVPHAPQFSGSVLRSVHVLVVRQYVCVALAHEQSPLWHVSGGPQIDPGHVVPQ